MNWLDRAEVKFGHLAIPGLIRIVVAFNALVFVLYKMNPGFLGLLDLDILRVTHGEIWRLVSYIFIPSFGGYLGGWISVFFYLLLLWFIGDGVEYAMGSFKLNAFYFLGMFSTTVAACLMAYIFYPLPTGSFSNVLLNATLLFAFARFYPNDILYVMGLIPIKVVWLAWTVAALLAFAFLNMGSWELRLVLLISVANYFIFFGKEIAQDAQHRSEVAARRERFERDIRDVEGESLHRCVVCGRTEHTAPDLEFRVSRDGNEYCRDHLPRAATPDAGK